MYHTKFLITTLALLCLATISWAQPKDFSPLSRFGLGNFTDPTFVAQGQMGGIRAAYNDEFEANFANPASLSYLERTSFEGGLYAKNTTFKSPSNTSKYWTGNLSYLALAFPMHNSINEFYDRKKRNWYWAMGFTLAPYSVVGYDIQTTKIYTGVPADTLTYNYQGRGGTYKVQWGNALRYRDFSLGLNLGYLFGKMSYERQVTFPTLPTAYSDLLLEEVSVGGVLWSMGAQYNIKIGKQPKIDKDQPNEAKTDVLTIGLYANNNQAYKTTQTYRYGRRNTKYSHEELIDSTSEDIVKEGTLPLQVGVGLMYKIKEKWKIGADYELTQWSNYVNQARPETFNNTYRLSMGAEYIPDINDFSLFTRTRYRFGGYYGNDPRGLANDQFKTYAFTGGISMPFFVQKQFYFMNLGVEYGKLYNTTLSENFFKINFGFTLTDNTWFYKRKFE